MRIQSALIASLLVLSGCNGSNNQNSQTKVVSSNYFSMRPQAPSKYIGMVQLNSPALLSSAKMEKGKLVVDEQLKEQIQIEHENIIHELKQISPEIEIITSYKLVLNAIAFVAPTSVEKELMALEGIGRIVENSIFDRPASALEEVEIRKAIKEIEERNSVKFIGADNIHKEGVTGAKMRVGVIDTGVDYTHAMMGGVGSKSVFDSINPNKPSEHFPNDKVIGGADFVGSDFSPSSADFEKTVPRRDENPIDESGHGTHVAGSIAGIGDGKFSYNGVAPEAKIYALKVFGKSGGTSEIAVIQALEYAADPTESLDPKNRLDVVNLSLGGAYGKPKVLYTEAVSNLVKAGTVVVASAGNSGDTPYITGAPATSDEAISVGASIDNMLHNIEMSASTVKIDGEELIFERTKSPLTVDADLSNVSGEFVYLGTTAQEISEELKKSVKGKIALVDRGVSSFGEKFKIAEDLGAVGVVVSNNVEGENIAMGGEGKFNIPAVMISKSIGDQIKAALGKSEVVFAFNSGKKILREDLVDTMTAFSSRGPRSMDSLIKPEIAGPGYNVISAENGTGNKYVQMSGTSMSGPHLAGAMALLREAFPNDSVAVLKAKLLNTAKILKDKNGKHIAVARQGAGRVQIDRAYKTKVHAIPATISLGEVPVAGKKRVAKKITITNTSNEDMVFATRAIHSKNIKVSASAGFKVKANSTFVYNVSFELQREDKTQNNIEADGFVILTNTHNGESINLPFLAVLNKVSDIESSRLVTHTNSKADRAGSEATLLLRNNSESSGDALIFNLLGKDGKKTVKDSKRSSSDATCDLEAAGIRIVETNEGGESIKMLQFGVKLYDSLTNWQPCDVSVQFDNNNDGVADQELVGILAPYISGINASVYASLLFDADLARSIRKNYEEVNDASFEENYMPALQAARPMYFYNHSNVAMIEVPLDNIVKGKKSTVGIKVALMHLQGNNDYDDFLGDHETKWQNINLSEEGLAFYDMPSFVEVNGHDQELISMRRGKGEGELLVLYPHNSPASLEDRQSQILAETLLK